MKTYLVGGAVRDLALGVEPKDRDYVVVGSSTNEMLALGFKQVGADFPVFLHPETGEEHALARTERKTGKGYHGFTVNADPSVTLEDDLQRRDLTINSMAMDMDTDNLIDPWGGLNDLLQGVLRHTSEAFADDPLRAIRLARFAARLPDFSIAPETHSLCMTMIEQGDLAELTQERVWAETYKALDSVAVSRFFGVLQDMQALELVPALTMFQGLSHMDIERDVERTQHLEGDLRKNVLVGTLLFHSRDDCTNAQLRGLPAEALQVKKLLEHDWFDFRPAELYDRLVKSGAMRGQWQFIFNALAIEDPEIVELNFQAMQAASKVTAAQFPGIEGKALGEAIRQARIKAVNVF
jgi:tRNA nucleotidyltransferase/poly(A) polymerase